MYGKAHIRVIIPSVASKERADYLLRAIDSALHQRGVRCTPIVIANGPSADPALVRDLMGRRDINFSFLNTGNQSLALGVGREMVDTPFFGELDDDDELTPHALRMRWEYMDANPTVDAVVTNAICRSDGSDRLSIMSAEKVQNDPLRSFMRSNWLLPGSALFRTATITSDFFFGMPQYLEWTYLALLLCMKRRIGFLQQPTVIHYTDRPFSITNSRECVTGGTKAIEALLQLEIAPDVRAWLKTRRGASYHAIADLHLRERQYGAAWTTHLKSLLLKRGWQYLPFTRHLIMEMLRRP
jgi:glycosyltransferase involved in cell wall biosynthesis